METTYIKKLTQEMLDLKYVAVLINHKVNGKKKKFSVKRMGKGLNKFFNNVVNYSNSPFPTLG